ncbi:MAG: hypothetical protein FJW31_13540 [Acidobacteria bacterium]|nr:hypothetical protein [Acidobacteriota bacterium]
MNIADLHKLNRYTTLPVLLDLLTRKKLVLLDPKSWEDKNDSKVMLEYKRRKKVPRLFALCFSYGDETIHQWRTFADGISGCCIEFNAQKLITALDGLDGVTCGLVRYRKLHELEDDTIKVEKMPFTKRWPYRCEDEFRVIWEGKSSNAFHEIPIQLNLIRKITINQRMPPQIYDTIRDHLRGVFAKPDQRISHSTLYENQRWLKKFRS